MIKSVREEYFNWLFDLVCGDRYSESVSFKELLKYLHSVEFEWSIPKDENRAKDGVNLRYRYSMRNGFDDVPSSLYGPCSVFEMMVALAIRCEEDIMDNPNMGDRTGQWFWNMISNLGLGSMTDTRFDEEYVDDVITRFLNREYEPDGEGGLFTIRNCDRDLRDVEIWYQLCWYLDTIT